MSILTTLHESPAPAAAVEIAAGRVSAASLEWRGGQAVVSAHASELLSGGAFGLEASLIAVVCATLAGIWLVLMAVRAGRLVQPWWVRRRSAAMADQPAPLPA